jgi:glutamyl-tRNA synthetase
MSDVKNPKVRFAPSPTGQLHLGSARTALFNYLFAKHTNGQFYMRIEDTDIERSKQKYVDQICASMRWLGLDWDGEPLFQSTRLDVYHTVIKTLLETDSAYRCFCSKDILEEARNEGLFQYSGTCRNLSEDNIKKHLNSGEGFVVRLQVPEGNTKFDDMIYGSVHVDHQEIDDFIIARSDGNPTYNLVVVVDDHEMEISHVIRGEDHISNTPKQILIYNAMGFAIPKFAHLPMILGPDKKRLSKRHGAPGIQQFKDDGYLPDALLNYLALLGWNPGSENEIFTLDELISSFEINHVHKKGAVYDEIKLSWISGQHMMRMGTATILEGIHEINREWGQGYEIHYLYSVLDQLKQRSKSLRDFIDQSSYFFNDPDSFDEKSSRKNWKNDIINTYIKDFMNSLEKIENWNVEEIESALRSIAEENETSAGKLIHPTRLALSGVPSGPSLFAMMELLGKDVCIRRLNKALETFQQS